jgi:hypothetical protein
MKYKLALITLLLPVAVFAQSQAAVQACQNASWPQICWMRFAAYANYVHAHNPNNQLNSPDAEAAGCGTNQVTLCGVGTAYLTGAEYATFENNIGSGAGSFGNSVGDEVSSWFN